MLKNKKAASKYLSIWLFFVFAMVGTGIVSMVYVFSSVDLNVRQLETDILITKVVDCMAENGKIEDKFLQQDVDILTECKLNKEIIDKDEGDYYLEINIYDASGKSVIGYPKIYGVPNIKEQCKISEEVEAEYYADCHEEKIDELNINILAGSKQVGKQEART